MATFSALHPVPECGPAYSGGPEQCPPDFRRKDAWFQQQTAGSLMGALIRLVANYDPVEETFSRTICSLQANKSLEIGYAHFARDRALKLLADIAQSRPQIAKAAWGEAATAQLAEGHNGRLAREIKSDFSGRTTFPAGYEWLAAGWASICRNPAIADLYTRMWYERYVRKAIDFMQKRGLKDRATLGLMTRLYNSGKQRLMVECLEETQDEASARECALGKYGRSMPYLTDPIWNGQIDTWPRPSDMSWSPGTGATGGAGAGSDRGGFRDDPRRQQVPAQGGGLPTKVAGIDRRWLLAGAAVVLAVGGWAIYRWQQDE